MTSNPDWLQIREQFPVFKEQTFLNTAANGLLPLSTTEFMRDHYLMFAHKGSYAADECRDQIENVRSRIASMINAEPEEIAFIPNVSSGMHYLARTFSELREISMMEDDFPTVRSAWELFPYKVHYFQSDSKGVIHPETILSTPSKILAISHVQWHTGFKLDVEEVGDTCRSKDQIFILDATQSLGNTYIDVNAHKIDALLASSYKWLIGGYGCAVLYLSKKLLDRFPVRLNWNYYEEEGQLFPDARRFEFGHERSHDVIRLGEGIRFMENIGFDQIYGRVTSLNHYLRDQLKSINIPVVSGFTSKNQSTLTIIPGNKALNDQLRKNGIITSLRGQGIRVSLHFYNNENDIDRLIHNIQ